MQTKSFEILLGTDKWTTRETQDSVVAMLAKRGIRAVKRGYTTFALYGSDGMRCGSMQDLG